MSLPYLNMYAFLYSLGMGIILSSIQLGFKAGASRAKKKKNSSLENPTMTDFHKILRKVMGIWDYSRRILFCIPKSIHYGLLQNSYSVDKPPVPPCSRMGVIGYIYLSYLNKKVFPERSTYNIIAPEESFTPIDRVVMQIESSPIASFW